MRWFWEVVESFTDEERSKLLAFCTSCPRPPLLGFGALNPRLGVRFLPEPGMLPSASTCFNLLKVPIYRTKQELREKLLYAISSKAGFDLS